MPTGHIKNAWIAGKIDEFNDLQAKNYILSHYNGAVKLK